MPGIKWVSRWVKQNSKYLKSSYLLPIDKNRKRANLALYYSLYFELLGRKIKEYDIQPQNMYNMDEKGYLIGHVPKTQRIFSKRAYESGVMRHIV